MGLNPFFSEQPVSTKAHRHDILLESGTNELEVLIFMLCGQRYGVNVAKVREVILPPPVTHLPESHASVMGMFRLRDSVTPLIDLAGCLGRRESSDLREGKIIIMEFNDSRVGFLVDAVEHIHRVSWQKVTALPNVQGVRETPITSVAHIKDQMVLMLDFEKLVFEIGGVDLFEQAAARIPAADDRGQQRILLAEDSNVMRKLIMSNLVKSGYTGVTLAHDGQEAWDFLEKNIGGGDPGFDLMITDIEMPRIDGLHLTKKVKDHPQMKHIPVIIFSSLVSIDNEKKCKSVGANAQITKPQLDQLVSLIDGLLLGKKAEQLEPAMA